MTDILPPAAPAARSTLPGISSLPRSFLRRRPEPEHPLLRLPDGPAWVDRVLAPGRRLHAPDPAAAEAYNGLAFFEGSNHFEALLRTTLEAGAIEPPHAPTVAVLGCGSGMNAVSPCLRLFRGAEVVAIDAREDQLDLLGAYLADCGAAERVAIVAADPEETVVQPGSVDLVIGVAVLHRLADPDRALAAAAGALKPGGHAIFMEPFDGHGLLRLAFQRICAEAHLRGETLESRLHAALMDRIEDIAQRTRPDTADPAFAGRDQKWLFARESLSAAAANLGFSEAAFFTHNDHPSLYRDLAAVRLAQRMGAESVDLPWWAWSILDEFDAALTPAVKRLLMIEGSIVLTR